MKKNTPENFWQTLPRPFFVLAPMYDVTDAACRHIIARYGKPHVMYTEFVSADGLAHPIGRKKLAHHLWFSPKERPIVVQLFGAHPSSMKDAAAYVASLGFDGIDINMGCPEKNVCKNGAGAALIEHPDRAAEIIRAAHEGVLSAGKHIPISVKTRIGYNTLSHNTWIPRLLETGIAALTVHLRTKKEMSDVPAHWELMPRIVALRDRLCGTQGTVIVGNGDVKNLTDAQDKAKRTGCDGVMLGRAVFGNPWLFQEKGSDKRKKDVKEKLRVMVEHTQIFEKRFTGVKNFVIMKKHYKAYCTGFPGAAALRMQLMATRDARAVASCVRAFVKTKNL